MFIEEEITDRRPFMAVLAPDAEFVYKYFDRQFDRRITENPAEAESGTTAFVVLPVDKTETDCVAAFRNACNDRGLRVVTLKVPPIIGTGMNGITMRLARGVARGTMLTIKDNDAKWSLIHATDIANAADAVSRVPQPADNYIIASEPVRVNDFIEALGRRIKDKRVGGIAPRWAKLLYGNSLYNKLTTDAVVDTSAFTSHFPEFVFVNPAEYLTTHVYDNESL